MFWSWHSALSSIVGRPDAQNATREKNATIPEDSTLPKSRKKSIPPESRKKSQALAAPAPPPTAPGIANPEPTPEKNRRAQTSPTKTKINPQMSSPLVAGYVLSTAAQTRNKSKGKIKRRHARVTLLTHFPRSRRLSASRCRFYGFP